MKDEDTFRFLNLYSHFSNTCLVESLILSEHEIIIYKQKIPSKSLQWLLGRLAAKKSIQSYLNNFEIDINICDIEIFNESNLSPNYKILGNSTNKNIISKLNLSISHCENHAIACVTPVQESTGLGVDIEKIQTFKEFTINSFMTEHEKKIYYSKISNAEKDLYATTIWSLKESYLKAIGEGLRLHPINIEIKFLSDDKIEIKRNDIKSIISSFAFFIKKKESLIITGISLG